MKSYAILSQNNFWTISKPITKIVGVETSLLLSDLVTKHEYFNKRKELDKEGYFFNTADNIQDDTTLSPHKQRKAITLLKEFGLIETKLKGVPAKLWYNINDTCIYTLIDIVIESKTSDKDDLQLVIKKFKNWLLNNLTTINKNKGNKNKEIIKKSKPKKDLKKPKLKRTKKIKSIIPSSFELFWKLYPKKKSKGAALNAWLKLCGKQLSQRPQFSELETAIKEQSNSEQWQNSQYIPNASTWLNQFRWLDDPSLMKNFETNNNNQKPQNNSGTHAYSDERVDYSVIEIKNEKGEIIQEEVPYDKR